MADAVIVFFLLFVGVMVGANYNRDSRQIDQAIAQCEQGIPRNQTCGYRIETFVKESE